MEVIIDKKNAPAGRVEELEGAVIGRFKLTQSAQDDDFIYFKGEPHAEDN